MYLIFIDLLCERAFFLPTSSELASPEASSSSSSSRPRLEPAVAGADAGVEVSLEGVDPRAIYVEMFQGWNWALFVN